MTGVWRHALILAQLLGLPFILPVERASAPRSSQAGRDNAVPNPETFPQFIEAARRNAMGYLQALPDFICTQTTRRYLRSGQRSARRDMMPGEEWRLEDDIVEELTYFDHKESYRLLRVDRRAGAFMNPEGRPGSSSTGEFASMLASLFNPASRAVFELEKAETIKGRRTVRAGYRVEQANSDRELRFLLEGNLLRTIKVAYRGRCWLDAATAQVVRLDLESVGIPPDFPIARSSAALEYGLVNIGGREFWLPVRAESLLATSSSRELPEHERLRDSRNVIEFKNYRRFGTDVKIQYPPP
ncbi:MAG: hypothetical protein HXY20_13320 [Acidobacteria bacterium]|nr:hypothetical protein [Acidobacteriota bacterium]